MVEFQNRYPPSNQPFDVPLPLNNWLIQKKSKNRPLGSPPKTTHTENNNDLERQERIPEIPTTKTRTDPQNPNSSFS